VVITTNIEFGLWDTVMSDSHLAKASADRMIHHGRLLKFRGESYRLKNSLMLGRGT
jgi:DNA replication protein DnaC